MTYTYETTGPGKKRRFELNQSMKDAPFTQHPETGEPIRRVITGGTGFKIRASRISSEAEFKAMTR